MQASTQCCTADYSACLMRSTLEQGLCQCLQPIPESAILMTYMLKARQVFIPASKTWCHRAWPEMAYTVASSISEHDQHTISLMLQVLSGLGQYGLQSQLSASIFSTATCHLCNFAHDSLHCCAAPRTAQQYMRACVLCAVLFSFPHPVSRLRKVQ